METKRFLLRICLMLEFVAFALPAFPKEGEGRVMGKVRTADGEAVSFATVYLKGTSRGALTDENGFYQIKARPGSYTLVVSAIGYKAVERTVLVSKAENRRRHRHDAVRCNVVLEADTHELEEVTVTANAGVDRVGRSAFNAVAVDAKSLHNTTKDLAGALSKVPGVKVRESGGVGSDMHISLDGFSGKHIKLFIDGIPQEGAGAAFSLNSIPANFAETVEVYKGVVPVGFGTDAIGGVINIVTNKNRRKWFADASYSYGSFNTHKSYVNSGQTLENGFMYEVNAFQNYSDNGYSIDTWVREWEIEDDGTVHKLPADKNDIKHVRRFNDRFHNEAVIGKVGVVGKTWADRLVFGFTYANFYKEIQTGVYQELVFGQKHRKGNSFVPSVEYRKRNLIVKDLDLTLAANYNHNLTNNVDTAARYYNWYGQYYEKDSRGEQSYQNSESKNTNWNATVLLNYRIRDVHTFTFSHVFSDFKRTSRSYVGTSSVLTSFDIPKITRKNISGLSYRLMPSEKWNASAFVKRYRQFNEGPVSRSADGVGDYVRMQNRMSSWGFGAAGTYFILPDLQAKLSYERAYRLPATDELFGDEDMEAGKMELRPEKSDNFNLSVSCSVLAGKHSVYVEGNLIYRDTKDYIKRGLDSHGGTQYGIYENHGHVKTKGYSLSLRYGFSNWFDAGIAYNDVDTRDYEKTWTGGSQQESMHYKVRLPNIPYRYANIDAGFHWHGLFAKGNRLSLVYDSFWQHEFAYKWENIGDKDSKAYVPTQFSHNLSLSCSIRDGRYNVSVECRNLLDSKLYDNFSLQKAGRAFYCKLRVHFGN